MTASLRTLTSRALAWRRRRTDAAGSQSGFALMLVLGVIGLTAVVVVALLGLAITSARVTAAQRETAREQRAASGALESAIGQIAHSNEADPCEALPQDTTQTRLVFENGDATGVTVEVECSSETVAPTGPSPVLTPPELVSVTPTPNPRHRFPRVEFVDFFGNVACISAGGCSRSFTSTWSATGSTPLSSVRLLFATDEGENIHNLNRNLSIAVTTPAGNCTVSVPGGRSNWWQGVYTSIELFDTPSCRDRLAGQPHSVLDGATIQVTHTYDAVGGCLFGACNVDLYFSGVKLLTNVTNVPAGSVSGAGAWSNSASLTTLDGTPSRVTQNTNCEYFADTRCRSDVPRQTYGFSLAGFTTGLEPEKTVESLGVIIDSTRNDPVRSWISDAIDETRFGFQLSVAGGGSCAPDPKYGFARSNQQLHVDLFTDDDCRQAVQTIEDLTNATLSYSVRNDCAHYGLTRAPETGGRCDTVRLPDIDRVALAVTTEAPALTASVATLTASVAGNPVTQADVLLDGSTDLPRPTPIVSWNHCRSAVCRPPSTP
jgi:hypothetical protein